MRLVDEKGKLFGKVNIIDLGVILVIVLFLAGLYVKGHISVVQEIQSPPQKIQVSIILPEMRDTPIISAIKVGDKVWESKTGSYLGVLVKKDVQPAAHWVDTADGRVVQTTIPGKSDVTIVVEGDGRMDDTTTLLGDTDMRVGSTVYVKGPRFAAQGVVVDAVEAK